MLATLSAVWTALEAAAPAIQVIGAAAIPIAALALRFVDATRRQALKDAVDHAYTALSGLAMLTPFKTDDAIAEVLRLVSEELGRSLSKAEQRTVKARVLSHAADPAKPGTIASAALARALGVSL